MAIVETKTTTRPRANIAFHRDSGEPAITSSITILAPFYTSGNVVATNDVSGDGLTMTMVRTYDTLSTWSQFDTLGPTIALDSEFYFYTNRNGLGQSTYSLAGIDQPFTCTTTYTFPRAGLSSHDDLHTLLADPPTYTKVLQEDEEVLVSEDKFNTLSMDQKLRNSPNRYPRVERVTIKDISIFDEGKQGDSSEFHEVYQIVPDVFIKLIVNTDSYGSNEFVAGFQIVTPKIKTVTAYEPI